MKRGIVVATHPGDHSVDVVLSDGRRLTGVQVLTPNGSARTGTFDMPAMPERKGDAKWDVSKPHGQDQIALVEFVGEAPVVVGFLYPQVSQMTFDDPKLRVMRHQSDVMTSIDGNGNIQLDHPSGTYIRIGEAPDRVDMAGKNADASLASDRNTGRRVNVRIGLAGGVLELTMTPAGAVSLKCNQTVSIEAGQPVTVKAPQVTLDTPQTHITGDVTVDGDVVASGVSAVNHIHTGVRAGGDTSSVPVR